MSKTNIISLGFSQSNFLVQLYSEIKSRNPNFLFHVDNFRDLSKGTIKYESKVFESYHNFADHKFPKAILFQSLIKLAFTKVFWRFLWFEFKVRKNVRGVLGFVKKEIQYKSIVDKIILPLNFDIYQFHYVKANKLNYIHYLPKNARMVCSFWGSDLYRNDSPYNAFYVKQALAKATNITIQTPEMAEDLYKKYGFFLKEKVIHAQFAIETEIYDLMDLYENEADILFDFKKQYSIPNNHKVITIGYNAKEVFKHIPILKELNKMDDSLKTKLTCILPLTYSRNDEVYLKELYQVIEGLDLNVVCFNSFMSHQDLAKSRLISDVQIQLPISDALSGSVTEALYAGNVVLAGAWLPYGIYERNNISIETLTNFEDLKPEIERILKNLEELKVRDSDRKDKIKAVFFPEITVKAWMDLYNKLK